jgi:hypothetical protein
MNTVRLFAQFCGKLTPCQEVLARLYFFDKERFAREVIHGKAPAPGYNYLFDLIKEFERKRAREAKKRFNVRTIDT